MTSLLDELKILLHGIWQRRWPALGVAWGLCVLGWLVIAMVPSRYESKARVQVEVTDVVAEPGAMPLDTQRRFDTLKDSLTSTRNLGEVAVAAGMIDRASDDAARARAAMEIQQATTVTSTPNNVIEFAVTVGGGGRSDAQNMALAPRIANAMIAQFRDAQMRDGAAGAEQNLRFLDAQLAEVQGKLTQAESARSAFEARNFGLLPGAGSASNRLDAARAELSQIDTQLVAVNSQLAATPPTIVTPGSVSTPVGVGVARQQLANAEAELSGMRARGLTAQHPDVVSLQAQIAALRAQAARETVAPVRTAGTSSPNPTYAGLAAQRSALGSRRAQLQGEISRITAARVQEPAVAAEYDRLTREYTVQKEQFDRLTARREQIRLRGAAEQNADAVRITVLDPPSVATKPTAPNKPLLNLGVLLAGLAGGVAAAFAMGQMQTTYPAAAKLARASGLPVIGSVTEILTPQLIAARRLRLRRFALGAAGLVCVALAVTGLEIVQRGGLG